MELIRSARAGDCSLLAELILLSDSGLFPALFGDDPRGALASLAARDGNPFSYRHAWVAEVEGRVAGAALGSRIGSIKRESFSTALLLARQFRLRSPVQFLRFARTGAMTKSLDASDFYLSNIAVFPQLRGYGYGGRLLLEVEASARAAGARRMVLDVDPENERAAAFYRRHGYSLEREIHLRIAKALEFAYRRMAKALSDPPSRS